MLVKGDQRLGDAINAYVSTVGADMLATGSQNLCVDGEWLGCLASGAGTVAKAVPGQLRGPAATVQIPAGQGSAIILPHHVTDQLRLVKVASGWHTLAHEAAKSTMFHKLACLCPCVLRACVLQAREVTPCQQPAPLR